MAKKRKKGAVRRLKVTTTDGTNKYITVYKYGNLNKTDEELLAFAQQLNALSSNEVTSIVRTDKEAITDAEPDFEKVEGIAVYNAEGKLITSKMTVATADEVAAMLNGADGVLGNEDDTSAYTIAVYDSKGKLANTTIQFATTADVAAMLNDNTPANFDNTDGYTLAMITSDGKLADSGVGFASAEDVNDFMTAQSLTA